MKHKINIYCTHTTGTHIIKKTVTSQAEILNTYCDICKLISKEKNTDTEVIIVLISHMRG